MQFGTTKCRRCGIEFRFPLDYGIVAYCSAHCRVNSIECAGAEFKGAIKSNYYSKNRRKAMARGDKIDPYVIYVAYDWICSLCDTPIDPNLKLPDPMAATLEHKIPLAKNGLHTWDNTFPAHASCNFLKAAS